MAHGPRCAKGDPIPPPPATRWQRPAPNRRRRQADPEPPPVFGSHPRNASLKTGRRGGSRGEATRNGMPAKIGDSTNRQRAGRSGRRAVGTVRTAGVLVNSGVGPELAAAPAASHGRGTVRYTIRTYLLCSWSGSFRRSQIIQTPIFSTGANIWKTRRYCPIWNNNYKSTAALQDTPI